MSAEHTALTELRNWCQEQANKADQQRKRRAPDPGKPWDQPRLDWTGRYIAYSHVVRYIEDLLQRPEPEAPLDRGISRWPPVE